MYLFFHLYLDLITRFCATCLLCCLLRVYRVVYRALRIDNGHALVIPQKLCLLHADPSWAAGMAESLRPDLNFFNHHLVFHRVGSNPASSCSGKLLAKISHKIHDMQSC